MSTHGIATEILPVMFQSLNQMFSSTCELSLGMLFAEGTQNWRDTEVQTMIMICSDETIQNLKSQDEKNAKI